LKASYIEGAPNGSTPIILVDGDTALMYDETPAARPPPPIGKNK
jgi:hypothetical protein